MELLLLNDKKIIENHFRKNTDFNVYPIGDLDDFFFKYTEWFSIGDKNRTGHIAYLYSGFEPPTFIALAEEDDGLLFELVQKIKTNLPVKFYSHLSPGLIKVFGKKCILKSFGTHYKMALKEKNLLFKKNEKNIRRLNLNDLEKIKSLFNTSYPDNFFDKRMLETGKYFGYFVQEKLIGISGIHVYSENYRVAALGNITIDSGYRRKSICQKLTSALCIDLLKTVDNIGLNVHTENNAAINCYKKIGFEIIGEYEEYLLENK